MPVAAPPEVELSHLSPGFVPLSTLVNEYVLPASNQAVVWLPETAIEAGTPSALETNSGGLGGVPPPNIKYPIETLNWTKKGIGEGMSSGADTVQFWAPAAQRSPTSPEMVPFTLAIEPCTA